MGATSKRPGGPASVAGVDLITRARTLRGPQDARRFYILHLSSSFPTVHSFGMAAQNSGPSNYFCHENSKTQKRED